MREEERIDSLWLCSLPGIGPVSIRKLMEVAGSPKDALKLSEPSLRAILGEKRAECVRRGRTAGQRDLAARRLENYRIRGISFVPLWDESYPKRLRTLEDAPVAIYVKGRLPDGNAPAAAVIGARECSEYGKKAARYFARGLAAAGVVVVSGMARGVDGIAGSAALEVGGMSVAVLGCGVDVCYPPENRALYERLEQDGCLLSEYRPGIRPESRLFPPRNRIISGLSDLVLVTEARERSGTSITVDLALEQGRDVFAVPGRITDSCSCGCNRLIAAGAGIALNVEQLLETMGRPAACSVLAAGKGQREKRGAEIPEKNENFRKLVLETLDGDPRGLDELYERLVARSGAEEASLQDLMQELVVLCMEGIAKSSAGRYFL